MSNRTRIRTSNEGYRSGWILLLAVVVGMALGAWLAFWVAGFDARGPQGGDPAAEWGATPEGDDPALAATVVDVLQVLEAYTPRAAPVSLPLEPGGLAADRYPKILLVALPNFNPRQRVFLLIRPADPALCRSLHGTELATYWDGPEQIALCAVGDPPTGDSAVSAVEFFLGRSS